MDRIYFDNAATTLKKPETVIRAVEQAMRTLGNSGRGAHDCSLGSMRTVYEAREWAAKLFGAESPSRIAFTMNATEALNIAIKGLIGEQDHVITTCMEHNSVLRPLYELEQKGTSLSFLPADERGNARLELLDGLLQKNTRAVVCTHASNVTGNGVDAAQVGEFCRKNGLLFILDASQSAGILHTDAKALGADVICFTGHKGLFGPQGTGGLYVREGVEITPLLSGGSGVQSFEKHHPQEMPTRLEAGTLNAHGLSGLAAGIEFVLTTGTEAIRKREQALVRRFCEGIREIPDIRIWGDPEAENHTGVISFTLGDWDSALVSDELAQRFGIASRPGAHCAPLMHEAMGTKEQGTVRFSFSWFNTEEEIEAGIRAVDTLARE